MKVEERGLKVQELKAYIQCTAWKHDLEKCDRRKEPVSCSELLDGEAPCGKQHHPLLHATGVVYCLAAGMVGPDRPISTLQFLQDAFMEATEARIHWDTGCTKTLETHAFAKKAGFRSAPANFRIQVVGRNWEEVKGKAYQFQITDRFGKRHPVWAYGLEEITKGAPGQQDLFDLRHLFPHVPLKVFKPLHD